MEKLKCLAINKTGGNCKNNVHSNELCLKHKDYIYSSIYGTEGATITMGPDAENHVNMQIITANPNIERKSYTYEDFKKIKELYPNNVEIIDLKEIIKNTEHYKNASDAYILIMRNGINNILSNFYKNDKYTQYDLYLEQKKFKWDTTALMYGKVVNKKARHNICYADFSQQSDIINGKGTVINFSDVSLLNTIRNELPKYFLENSRELVGEGNLYYNINYNGIGYHGDGERNIVVGIRLGVKFPLRYQWYLQSSPIGEYIDIDLNAGDIYVMSDKAVGYDWKTRKIPTLRHAAGSSEYININK